MKNYTQFEIRFERVGFIIFLAGIVIMTLRAVFHS